MHRLAAEFVGTFGLVFAGTGAIIINDVTGGTVSHLGFGLKALFAGPISGASMNPARSLAPAIVSQTWQDQWLYVAGPAIGAMIGVIIYNAIRHGEPQTG